MLNSNEKGAIAELEIATAALKLGVAVYKPLSEHSRADLIFEIGERRWRVQCKWGALSPQADIVAVRLQTSRHSPTQGYVISTYTEQEIDLFGVYCGELDRCFLLPIGPRLGVRQIHFRLVPARNNQRSCINLADDFDFEGAVAQLARASAWHAEGQGFEPPQLYSSKAGPVRLGSNAFRERLGYWMDRIAAGEEVILTRPGKPRIRLSPAV